MTLSVLDIMYELSVTNNDWLIGWESTELAYLNKSKVLIRVIFSRFRVFSFGYFDNPFDSPQDRVTGSVN